MNLSATQGLGFTCDPFIFDFVLESIGVYLVSTADRLTGVFNIDTADCTCSCFCLVCGTTTGTDAIGLLDITSDSTTTLADRLATHLITDG